MKKRVAIILSLLTVMICATYAMAQYRFYGGEDWSFIESSTHPDQIKAKIKLLMIEASQQSAIFSGNPILSPDEKNFGRYIAGIDNFYSDDKNKVIPLYFAIKVAEMQLNGLPQEQVAVYAQAVVKKLKDMGLAH